jgi:glyoxylase-like metal-dependent hydrolase (beta-lactamase superfamily II)
MIFKHFLLDVEEANAFLVACEKTRRALLVDVGEFDARIQEFLEENRLQLATIFITHDHHDHTGGLAQAVAQWRPQVIAGSHVPGGCTARRAAHGDPITIGEIGCCVLATPGHTPDSMSLVVSGHVFTGDALFAGSVGGTTSHTLAQQQIDHIRRNIFSLPADFEIHPGHGPSSTVAVESCYNPFFS